MEPLDMSESLSHLNRAIDALVLQNREREHSQNQIKESLAVLQNDVKRLAKFIDEERIPEKVARMEERQVEGAAHRIRLEGRVNSTETEIESIKNKLLWGLIGGIGAVLLGAAQVLISKLHL